MVDHPQLSPRAGSFSEWLREISGSARERYERILATVKRDSQELSILPGGKLGPYVAAVITAGVCSLFRLGFRDIYTESILFMAIGLGFGLLTETTGMLFVATYATVDLITLANALSLQTLIGRLVSYWLLALLVVAFPNVQRFMYAAVSTTAGKRRVGSAGAPFVSALVIAPLVYLWTIGVPYLIRSVFRGFPTEAAIRPLQESGLLLAGIAFGLALLISLTYQRKVGVQLRRAVARPSRRFVKPVEVMRRLVGYVLAIVVLGGIVTSAFDIALLLGALLLGETLFALMLRIAVFRSLLAKVPYLLRFMGAFIGTFLIAYLIMTSSLYRPLFGSGFFPLVLSVAAGFLLFRLLVGMDGQALGTQPPPSQSGTRTPLSILLPIAFMMVGALPQEAFATDCSSLPDCQMGSIACTAAGFAAIVVAIVSRILGALEAIGNFIIKLCIAFWSFFVPVAPVAEPDLAPQAVEGALQQAKELKAQHVRDALFQQGKDEEALQEYSRIRNMSDEDFKKSYLQ